MKMLLPTDVVVADKFAEDANTATCAADAMPSDMMGLDIGPETEAAYAAAIAEGQNGVLERPHGRVRDEGV